MNSILDDVTLVKEIVSESSSRSEILRKLGLTHSGPMYKRLNTWAEQNDVTLPNGGGTANFDRVPDEEVFVRNSTFTSNREIKQRLKDEGRAYHCAMEGCPMPEPVWRGETLVLHLDHINGVSNDNRRDNLRFLCPNCHTQTVTYGSRNKKNPELDAKKRCHCGNPKLPTSKECTPCSDKARLGTNTKIDWPETEVLVEMIKESNFLVVAKKLGVADNTVRKHLARREVDYKSL